MKSDFRTRTSISIAHEHAFPSHASAHSFIMQSMEESCSTNFSNDQAKEQLLGRLLTAHEAFYDVQHPYEFGGRTFPGYAEFHTHGEKYVLSKKAKLWEVDAHEYLFFYTCDTLDAAGASELIEFMTTKALAQIQDVPDHMTSYLSLIIICDQAATEAIALIKRARFRKNFLFGFHGWADLRLALITLETMQVYTNGQGKKLKATLEANLKTATNVSHTTEKENQTS